MSLHRQIAHGTIIQITGKIISTLLGFVAIALMTRTLGAEQFGWYVTAAGFLQFFGVVSDFGFALTTSNMLSEGRFDRSKIINTIITWRTITAFGFQLAAPLIFLFFPFSWPIKLAVAIMSASFFFQAINQVFIGLYREQLRMTLSIMGEVVGRVALVIGIAAVSLGHYDFLWMMGAVTVASLASTLYYWRYAPAIRFKIDRAVSEDFFSKTWPTAVSIILNSFYYQAGRIILPLYMPQVEVGLFGAALRVYDIVIQIAALIMGMLMPLITYAWARKMLADFKDRVQLSLNLMTVLLIPLITGMILLGRPLMMFVAGQDFTEAGYMLSIIAFSLFASCFGMVFGHVILAINRQRTALWIYLVDAVISFSAYWYAIPHFGWRGAAAVMIFSEIIAGVGLTLLTLYYSRIRLSYTALVKIILATGIMALYLYHTPQIPLLINIVLGVLIYGVGILLLRVMTWNTIRPLLTRS